MLGSDLHVESLADLTPRDHPDVATDAARQLRRAISAACLPSCIADGPGTLSTNPEPMNAAESGTLFVDKPVTSGLPDTGQAQYPLASALLADGEASKAEVVTKDQGRILTKDSLGAVLSHLGIDPRLQASDGLPDKIVTETDASLVTPGAGELDAGAAAGDSHNDGQPPKGPGDPGTPGGFSDGDPDGEDGKDGSDDPRTRRERELDRRIEAALAGHGPDEPAHLKTRTTETVSLPGGNDSERKGEAAPEADEVAAMHELYSPAALALAMELEYPALQGISPETHEQNLRILEIMQGVAKKLPASVLALQLVGSRFHGYSWPDSDIDCNVVTYEDPDEDEPYTVVAQRATLTLQRALAEEFPHLRLDNIGYEMMGKPAVPSHPMRFVSWLARYPLNGVALFGGSVTPSPRLEVLKSAAVEVIATAAPFHMEDQWAIIRARHADDYVGELPQVRRRLHARLTGYTKADIDGHINQEMLDARAENFGLPADIRVALAGQRQWVAENRKLISRMPAYAQYKGVLEILRISYS